MQWNIATLLLLTAVVGVWTSYVHMTSEQERMDAELDSLLQLARELVIDDPSQYAIVERHEEWNAEDVWEVHLPEGNGYVLKLATRGIAMKVRVRGIPRDDFPETFQAAELTPGKHVISLEKTFDGEGLSARVIVDGTRAVEAHESDDWKPQGGYSSDGNHIRSTQSSPDQPLELIRIRFHNQSPGVSKFNGVLLWIERK